MNELQETLEKYGDDTECVIVNLGSNGLEIRLMIASRGGEQWSLLIPEVIWMDMGTGFTLGNTSFGGIELLPTDYWSSRNDDCGGERGQYRVIKFTDIDAKIHRVVFLGKETFRQIGSDLNPHPSD